MIFSVYSSDNSKLIDDHQLWGGGYKTAKWGESQVLLLQKRKGLGWEVSNVLAIQKGGTRTLLYGNSCTCLA